MDDRDHELLKLILDSARVALGYANRSGTDWHQDGMTVDAICKRVEEVGELSKRLSPEIIVALPEIDWRRAAGFRDFLVREYVEVDLRILVEVIDRDLPELVRVVGSRLSAGGS
ncbi:MAG: HepT-like ribonuclease domain-containing protein [Actinomycetota bacterium]